jgi:ferritin
MHALKFLHYIVDAGGQVRIPKVKGPKFDIPSAKAAVQMALDWEEEVTRQINSLMDLALSQNDHIAQDFLRWFVTEQLEEVSTMSRLLKVVERAGANLLLVEDFLSRESLGAAAPAE